MLERVKAVWELGVVNNSVQRRRQIELVNQVGLFGAAATLLYQLFYFFYDLSLFYGVFMANLAFTTTYLSVLVLNSWCRYAWARLTLLINVNLQLFVVTAFIGAEAGVHLFYFTIASVLVFLTRRLGWGYFAHMALMGALYMTANFLFTSERALSPVPKPWVDVMYVGSGIGVLTLLGIFLYLFRQQIDQAECELTLMSRHFKALSDTDPLTGLANRRVLDESLQREWLRLSRRPGALAILMCDVDYFKDFNDHYGHDAGDECLKRIAAELEKMLSRPSDLIARYGGEEFAFVLPGTGEQGARHLGETLRKAVRSLDIPHGTATTGVVTMSIGISSIDTFDPAFNSADTRSQSAMRLLKCADQALYQAKMDGRDRVVFLPYTSTENQ